MLDGLGNWINCVEGDVNSFGGSEWGCGLGGLKRDIVVVGSR